MPVITSESELTPQDTNKKKIPVNHQLHTNLTPILSYKNPVSQSVRCEVLINEQKQCSHVSSKHIKDKTTPE